MTYTLYHCHSDGSLLDGFAKPKEIVQRAKELNMKSIGISDHGNVINHIKFHSECKKNGIKPILGIELYCSLEPAYLKVNRDHTHMVMFAKNKNGLKDLWRMVSYSNKPEIYYYKPRLQLHNVLDKETNQTWYGVEEFTKNNNIIGISGHQGSYLSDNLFADIFGDPEKRKQDIRKAYGQYKEADEKYHEKFLKANWLESTCNLALELENVFGKGNFFIELQDELNPNDQLPLWVHPVIVNCLREVSKCTGIPAIASSDPHYAYKEQAIDQRAVVMINMREDEESVQKKLDSSDETDVMVFFGSDQFFIHSYEEMSEKFSRDELELTNRISDLVEEYEIKEPQQIPTFPVDTVEFDKNNQYLKDCPTDQDKLLMYLAIKGAQELKPWEISGIDKKLYWDRLQEEAKILFKAGLSNYLLLVWDFMSFANYRPADGSFDWQANLRNNGDIDPLPTGAGRGSIGGCLTAYFLKIHKADSLKYNLLFSRFFNEARIGDLADIDTDLSIAARDIIVQYLEWKYGSNRVAQILTLGKIMGKQGIRDLIRIKGIKNGVDLASEISEFVPDEASIADELQLMKNEGDDGKILEWCLENSEDFKKYYNSPELKTIIDQAIRIEGTYRNAGRHASGFVIANDDVENLYPMVLDTKSKKQIIGFDMKNIASTSAVKIDLLGLGLLSKLDLCQKLVNK